MSISFPLALLKPAGVVSISCCWKSFPLSVFRFPFVEGLIKVD